MTSRDIRGKIKVLLCHMCPRINLENWRQLVNKAYLPVPYKSGHLPQTASGCNESLV